MYSLVAFRMTWSERVAVVAAVSAALFAIDFFFFPYASFVPVLPRLGIDLVLLLLPILLIATLIGLRWSWVVITLSLLGLYGSDFLNFLVPIVGYWLPLISVVSAIPLLIISLVALVKRRWRSIAAFAATWALLIIHVVSSGPPASWLMGLGFRIHTLSVQDYLSKCDLSDFVENGVKQTAGWCEAFDRGNYFEAVMYDTTGEFLVPAARRTPEWKQVVSQRLSKVADKDDIADHLFGNFYRVVASSEDH